MTRSPILLFLILGLAFSCNKPNAPDCFQKAGEEVVIRRDFNTTITKLILRDYIQYELIPSSDNYIEILGPENLLPEILTEEIENGKVEIKNDNTCNFVRSYKRKITVRFHMKIVEIENYASGDLQSNDTLVEPYFLLNNHEASGAVNLTVKSDSLRINIHGGVSNVDIQGITNKAFIFNGGTNYLNASHLLSNFAFVNSSTISSTSVESQDYLFVAINSSGSVYYRGNPNLIDLVDNGSGELIPQ